MSLRPGQAGPGRSGRAHELGTRRAAGSRVSSVTSGGPPIGHAYGFLRYELVVSHTLLCSCVISLGAQAAAPPRRLCSAPSTAQAIYHAHRGVPPSPLTQRRGTSCAAVHEDACLESRGARAGRQGERASQQSSHRGTSKPILVNFLAPAVRQRKRRRPALRRARRPVHALSGRLRRGAKPRGGWFVTPGTRTRAAAGGRDAAAPPAAAAAAG
jgi:hypothetical protein